MRLLFVSSTMTGGSGRSQRELADRLLRRGHEVRFLADDKSPARLSRWIGGHLADATERFPRIGLLRRLEAVPGSRPTPQTHGGVEHLISPIPQNAFASVLDGWRPDVVVGNSVERFTWRRIRTRCAAMAIPTVLYVREVTTLGHLDIEPDPGDVLVANARSLTDAVVEAGRECEFIPSVIDTSATSTPTDRTVALLVNPIETHGIDLLWAVAAALPDVPFIIQESWELDDEQEAAVFAGLRDHPNVTLRRRQPPGPELYATTRLLLVPHRIDNRPRVIAEAHANSIPALVSDFGGLREAVGAGGEVLPADDPDAWIAAIDRLWSDSDAYETLAAAAAAESRRPEIDPEAVVGAFEAVLERSRERTAG